MAQRKAYPWPQPATVQHDAGAGDTPATAPEPRSPSMSLIAAALCPVFLRRTRGCPTRPWRVLVVRVHTCTLNTNCAAREAARWEGGALTLCYRASAPPGPRPVASAGTPHVSFPPKSLLPAPGGGEERGLGGEVRRQHGPAALPLFQHSAEKSAALLERLAHGYMLRHPSSLGHP